MRADELNKFSDDTLISVRDTLSQMVHELNLGYNKTMKRRQLTSLGQQRTHIMIKAINQKLQDRRIMRSLEKFVGGREYGERPSTASSDNMTFSYLVLLFKDITHILLEFNWDTATYGKVRYFKDINYFKDFKNEFPTIVYKNALTSKPKVSSKPTVSARHVKKVDFYLEMSFEEFDDEDYTFTYDKNSFLIN
ncbi:hypothetical protein Tco_0538049 [Tanacetum coccineum]